ncbi:MAG: ParB/RepB/Spo0J family partition protein [Pseudomonadota bacterium]|nr:ParB/RepB/Spo0J family partition protein [Pseudomonadota bacterium]
MISTEEKRVRRGLGRGLSALFGEEEHATATKIKSGSSELAIHVLKPGKFQPRRHFDDSAHAALVASVKDKGVLEPILVRALDDSSDNYEIIAGERRWRAAQAAGLHKVPVVVKQMDDREALEVALIENLHRSDLSPLEEAEAYSRLLEEFGHTQEQLAKAVGKSRSHVANMIRLLALPDSVKNMVLDGRLSAGHARALITFSEPELLASEIVAKGLSVRQLEKLIQRSTNGAAKRSIGKNQKIIGSKDPNTVELEGSLSDRLGLKVMIETKGEGGTLSVQFQSLEQLDDLLQILTRS